MSRKYEMAARAARLPGDYELLGLTTAATIVQLEAVFTELWLQASAQSLTDTGPRPARRMAQLDSALTNILVCDKQQTLGQARDRLIYLMDRGLGHNHAQTIRDLTKDQSGRQN